jgi:hypothetical protein
VYRLIQIVHTSSGHCVCILLHSNGYWMGLWPGRLVRERLSEKEHKVHPDGVIGRDCLPKLDAGMSVEGQGVGVPLSYI